MAIITISRGTYSGGKELAKGLADRLGYRLLSREQLLTDATKEYGVSEDKLETALMLKPGFLEGLSLKRIHYIAYVTAALCKEVQADNVVYHGQAGHLLLKHVPHHLRLKVVADMEYRIKAAMARSNFTHERAIEYIKHMDGERDKWVKALYNVDRTDPSTYDMVINLENIHIDKACDIVAHAVGLGFQTTPESQKRVDDLVVSSEIRARIAVDAAAQHIADEHIDVDASDGIVTLTGTVRSIADADKIREIARQQAGVKDIVSRMGTRW